MKSTKKIFNVASYNRLHKLVLMLYSIYDQADEINVILNYDGFAEIDLLNELKNREYLLKKFPEKVRVNVMLNYRFGDSGKFLMLKKSDGYFFTVDDDLIYPSTYADDMIKAYEKYEGKAIVALHGRTFRSWPIESYYNSDFVKFRALGDVLSDVQVEFAGTCTTMWHTDLLQFDPYEISTRNMGDIWLSYFAKMKDIPIVVLAHNSDYLKYLLKPKDKTIFADYKENHSFQTKLANLIYGKTK